MYSTADFYECYQGVLLYYSLVLLSHLKILGMFNSGMNGSRILTPTSSTLVSVMCNRLPTVDNIDIRWYILTSVNQLLQNNTNKNIHS